MAITQAQWEEASLRARNTPALPPVKSTAEALERMHRLGIKVENESTSSGPLVIVGSKTISQQGDSKRGN